MKSLSHARVALLSIGLALSMGIACGGNENPSPDDENLGGSGGSTSASGGKKNMGGAFEIPASGGQNSSGGDGSGGKSMGGETGSGGQTSTGNCGDGFVDRDERCDPGANPCCNAECSGPARAGTSCRTAVDACDREEVCDGRSTECPLDMPSCEILTLPSAPGSVVTVSTANGCELYAPTCLFEGYTSGKEVLFRYRAPAAGNYIFHTLDSDVSDTALYQIKDLSCDTEELACNDDLPGTLRSALTIGLRQGAEILLAAEGFGNEVGLIRLEVVEAPPAGWTCGLTNYLDAKCDCGCGVADPACTATTAEACEVDGCGCPVLSETCTDRGVIDPANPTQCIGAPDTWACADSWYYDEDCDCGCSIADPACADLTSASCEYTHCDEGQVAGATDNTTCESGWTCQDDYYDDGDCDCGCGIVDIDCADSTSTSCQYQYCPDGTEPGPTNNAICVDEP